MTGVIATIPRMQFSNALGIPLAGGKLITYAAGTNTPAPTYQDRDLTAANPTSITLDSTGSCLLWLDPAKSYKFVLKNALGVTQPGWPVDNISGAASALSLESRLSTFATSAALAAPDGASLIGFARDGEKALERTVQDKLREFVTITDYEGVVGDGVTNCTDGIGAAIRNNLSLEIPIGTFVCAPTLASGDFMLYLGTKNGQAARDGLTIKGKGLGSVLKLANNAGRAALLFGAGVDDKVKNLTIRDLTIDLNGLNNLQTSFDDPLRYNCAAYFHCFCENVLFENVTFLNASGHQVISIGDNTPGNYGKNVRVKNCHFKNYGMGVPGNKSQDTSALYIQADGIEVIGNTFECDQFTFDPARGHTGAELHGDSSTIVCGNRFRNVQLPWLMASSQKPMSNVTISHNRYTECFYLGSLDGDKFDQKVIDIGPGEIFNSTKPTASLLRIGNYAEVAKNRENVRFFGNQVIVWGDTNEDVHFCDLTNCYIRSLEIFNNRFGGLTGSVVYYAGVVRNSGLCDISIHDNEMDSLGSTGGPEYPNSPTFLHIETSEGTINTLAFNHNALSNSAGKDYTALGLVKLTGAINYIYVTGNKSSLSSSFPLTTGAPVCVYKKIDKSYPSVWQVGSYESPGFTQIPAGGTLDVFDFSAWTQNNWTAFRVTVFATDGGPDNNGLVDYDVLVCGSGRVATRLANTGAYATDITVGFTGSVLRISNASSSPLFVSQAISGNSSRSVNLTN